jgi:hypothetical protein
MPAKSFCVFLIGVFCLPYSCAWPVLPLSPGTSTVANSTNGLVFGRIEIIHSGTDQMAYSFGKEFGWWLTRAGPQERFVVRTLTREGPFVVNLPGGHYSVTGLIYDEGAGVWEGTVPASFHVTPGTETYVGTWQIEFGFQGNAGPVSARVRNDIKQAQHKLAEIYTGQPKPLLISLLDSAPKGYFSLIELRIGQ